MGLRKHMMVKGDMLSFEQRRNFEGRPLAALEKTAPANGLLPLKGALIKHHYRDEMLCFPHQLYKKKLHLMNKLIISF